MKWFVYGLVSWVVSGSSVAFAGSDDLCPGWTRHESYADALEAARSALRARVGKACVGELKIDESEVYVGIDEQNATQTWNTKMVIKTACQDKPQHEYNFKIVNTTNGCTLNDQSSDEFGFFVVGVDELPTPAAAQARRTKSVERKQKSL